MVTGIQSGVLNNTVNHFDKKAYQNSGIKNVKLMNDENSGKKDSFEFDSSVVIPENISIPDDLKTQKTEKKQKSLLSGLLLPLAAASIVALGATAIFTKIWYKTSKLLLQNINNPDFARFPAIARNMNLKNESQFVIFAALENSSVRNFLGAIAVLASTAAVFVAKNFIDGFKDIWIKKQEANIQKTQQERLISIETRSFAGKNQILRNMLAETSGELSQTVKNSAKKTKNSINFKGLNKNLINNKVTSQNEKKESPKNNFLSRFDNNWGYLAIGAGTLLISGLLAYLTHKNIKLVDKEINLYKKGVEEAIGKILAVPEERLKDKFIDMLASLKPEKLKSMLEKHNIPETEQEAILAKVREKTSVHASAPEALGGIPRKISYYSYIDDVLGHLYNFIINPSAVTRNLFLALAAVTGSGYIGRKAVEAIKEVQVKKANMETDVELHDRLVETELKNFMSKKKSFVAPAIDEFKHYAAKNPDNRGELEKRYNNILNDIKQGPPYVWS